MPEPILPAPVSVLREADVPYAPLGAAPALELARVLTEAATTGLGGGFARFPRDGELAGWTLAYDEVFLVLEGRMEILCEGVTVAAVAGEALLVPRGSTVTYRGTAGTRAFFVLHPRDWAEQAAPTTNGNNFSPTGGMT